VPPLGAEPPSLPEIPLSIRSSSSSHALSAPSENKNGNDSGNKQRVAPRRPFASIVRE
jgi:hypothetical protein